MNKKEISIEHQSEQKLAIIKSESKNIVCPQCLSSSFKKAGFNRQKKQRYKCKQCNRSFILNSQYHSYKVGDEDILTASDLGLKVALYKDDGDKLNFSLGIKQEWLKEYFKKFIQYKANQTGSFRYLQKALSELREFSKFLSDNYPEIDCIENLNRQIIINYLNYLSQKPITSSTKKKHITALTVFLETGNINNWFNVQSYLIRKEDYPKQRKSLPRYIPDEVLNQLNQHLDSLPKPIMRMVLVIQECGLRIGELCQLPLDCLKQDNKRGWFIQFIRWKLNFETTLPISTEIAEVIKEQQAYIEEHFGKKYQYLFCSRKQGTYIEFIPQAKMMTARAFADYLKRLGKEFNICDRSGKPWNFQTHQFRHTVGTRMINAGVPQHIIQRYLGHESPAMTAVYAHIHDQTLRKEIEKYHESRVVNFQGETVELEETILSSNDDLEWFKKNVQARALEHGYCARPKLLGDCDISGFDGCYNCPHWRTNKNFLLILRDTLDRTNKVIEKARNCGWELQVKKNEPIKHNLEKVIKSLEEESDE